MTRHLYSHEDSVRSLPEEMQAVAQDLYLIGVPWHAWINTQGVPMASVAGVLGPPAWTLPEALELAFEQYDRVGG